MNINRFNLRVYGLLRFNDQIMVTHENRAGMMMTKYPGGGLEMGEGLADCLVREFAEELQIKIEVGELFYVNEFFQQSEFNKADQLISFYFWVYTEEPDEIPVQTLFKELKRGQQIFEWKEIAGLDPENFTFPIDKIVAGKLLSSTS